MSFVSGKCSSCYHNMEPGEKYLTCALCKNSFHGACENLNDKLISSIFTLKEHVIWLCASCKMKDLLNLLQLIPEILQKQDKLSEEVKYLRDLFEKNASSLTAQPSYLTIQRDAFPYASNESALFAELELRRRKENTIFVTGLQVTGDVRKFFLQFCADELKLDVGSSVSRIYKCNSDKSLIFVTFNNMDSKIEILKKARTLRKSATAAYRKVFINPDRTPMQRERLKVLLSELKMRRLAGERVCLREDKIVTINSHYDE